MLAPLSNTIRLFYSKVNSKINNKLNKTIYNNVNNFFSCK